MEVGQKQFTSRFAVDYYYTMPRISALLSVRLAPLQSVSCEQFDYILYIRHGICVAERASRNV